MITDDLTPAYIRAVQGHCSRPTANPEFFKNMIEIPHGWTNVICHASYQAKHRATSRIKFQSGFNLAKNASLLNLPTHTMSRWNNLQVSKKKTQDDVRVGSEEASTDLPPIANRSKRPHTGKPTSKHNFFFHAFSEGSRLWSLQAHTNYPSSVQESHGSERRPSPSSTTCWWCCNGGS